MFDFSRVMRRVFLTILILSILFTNGSMTITQKMNKVYASTGATYYVAITGDDNSGDGSLSNPWKTIQKAGDMLQPGDTCIIREGTYYEEVKPTSSGTASAPITYKSYDNELVIISGADTLDQWELYQEHIYRAPLSTDTVAVFVDGEEMIQARWPNKTSLNKLVRSDSAVADSGTVTTITDNALTGDEDFYKDAIVWFTGGGTHVNWTAQTSHVIGFSPSTRTLTIEEPQATLHHRIPAKGSDYYLMGKMDFLDHENEWHYADGYLYLWLPGNSAPDGKDIKVKRRKWGFNLDGKDYIHLEGLQFFATSATLDNSTYCVIDQCDFKYVASDPWINYTYSRGGFGDHTKYAPWWDSSWNDVGVYISGSHNTLKNSSVAYSYGDCVTVLGSFNTVKNNILHDANFSGTECGVITVKGDHHEIVCNTMYNAGRSVLQHNYVESSRFLFNHIYNAGLLTRDLGVTYCYITDGKGTEIAYNWVHDNLCDGYGGGIYLDNGSSNFLVHHNVVWDCPTMSGIFYNSPATSHETYNNTIWNCGEGYGVRMNSPYYNLKVYNNLSNKPFMGNDVRSNLTTLNPNFIGEGEDGLKFRLKESSSAKNSGMLIDGITDGYNESAPDIGAYEYGGEEWIAGHLATAPPAPVYEEEIIGPKKVNDSDQDMVFSWNWTYYTPFNNAYLRDLHVSKTPGEYVEYTFDGVAVKWIGGKNKDHGKVDIFIDGEYDATVDTYHSSLILQQDLYIKTGLTPGTHTIKILLRNDKNVNSTGYATDCDSFISYPQPVIENNKNSDFNIASTDAVEGAIYTTDHFGHALSVMTDGIKVDNANEDSWNGTVKSEDYWGLTFNKVQGMNKVVYTTGKMFIDGGWFKDGLKVQVRQYGQWVDVSNTIITPDYPNDNTAGPNKSYTIRFDDTWGDGVRVYGVPDHVSGYNFSFTSVGEFEVYYE